MSCLLGLRPRWCVAVVVSGLLLSEAAGADTIFGVSSLDGLGGSTSPTTLFSFESNDLTGATSSFQTVGAVTLGGVDLDVDGLAHDGTTLYGFNLTLGATNSQLIAIDTSSAIAATLGSVHSREIRGATFVAGVLWGVDTLNDVLVPFDTSGVADDGAALGLTDGGTGVALGQGATISFFDGNTYFLQSSELYTIDMVTGALTHQKTLASVGGGGYIGGEFGAGGQFYVTEVNGLDELIAFDDNLENGAVFQILPYGNSGRGDLARAFLSVPEPGSAVLLLIGMTFLRRRCR